METVIKKFKFRNIPVIINAPADLETEFKEPGFKTSFDKKEKSTDTLVFINDSTEYKNFLEKYLKNIAPDSVLWFAYPKGTSKIKTDINRDSLRETGESFGITTVAIISVNYIWSALRFRPVDKVGK